MLPLSDNLFLIHTSSAGEGKTKEMAKGLILCHQGGTLGGESAGFGLPVLKTENQTIFPSLFSSKLRESRIIEVVYHLNLINTWRIMGVSAPSYFRYFMEKIARFYMSRPELQSSGLKIRNAIFKMLRIRSKMVPGKSYGYCQVLYQTGDLWLKISVNGQKLLPRGKLILLNEVPGIGFSRLKTRTIKRTKSGWNTRDGNNFLPWQTCTIETAVENPSLHIGFFLSFPDTPNPPRFQIAAGREVARDLNWAGLAMIMEASVFTYYANFYSRKNEES